VSAGRLIPAGCAVVGRASRGGEDDLACGLLSLAGCSFVGRSSRGSGEEAPSSSVALGTRTEGGVSCSEVPGNCRQASAIRAADRASIVIAKRSSPRFPSPTTQLSVCHRARTEFLRYVCIHVGTTTKNPVVPKLEIENEIVGVFLKSKIYRLYPKED
jgi:hypothetical protein